MAAHVDVGAVCGAQGEAGVGMFMSRAPLEAYPLDRRSVIANITMNR